MFCRLRQFVCVLSNFLKREVRLNFAKAGRRTQRGPDARPHRGPSRRPASRAHSAAVCPGRRGMRQTLEGSFSAGWLAGKPDYPQKLEVPEGYEKMNEN